MNRKNILAPSPVFLRTGDNRGSNLARLTTSSVKSSESATRSSRLYANEPLPFGVMYEVQISNVEDGMKKFTIHLKGVEQQLVKLQMKIKNLKLYPIKSTVQGSPCLAWNKLSRTLQRGLIKGSRNDKHCIYFVDFGHSDTMEERYIFEIPDELLKVNLMAHRVSLAGCEELAEIDECKELFKTLVNLRWFRCFVVEAPQAVVLIDESGRDVKDILQNKFAIKSQDIREGTPSSLTVEDDFLVNQIPQLEVAENENVFVTFVYSADQFFAQLERLPMKKLNQLQAEMFCTYSRLEHPPLLYSDVYSHLGDVAVFKWQEDGHFYRVTILEECSSEVIITFVDYGNVLRVPKSSLYTPVETLTRFHQPPFGIKCQVEWDVAVEFKKWKLFLTDQSINVKIGHFDGTCYQVTLTDDPKNCTVLEMLQPAIKCSGVEQMKENQSVVLSSLPEGIQPGPNSLWSDPSTDFCEDLLESSSESLHELLFRLDTGSTSDKPEDRTLPNGNQSASMSQWSYQQNPSTVSNFRAEMCNNSLASSKCESQHDLPLTLETGFTRDKAEEPTLPDGSKSPSTSQSSKRENLSSVAKFRAEKSFESSKCESQQELPFTPEPEDTRDKPKEPTLPDGSKSPSTSQSSDNQNSSPIANVLTETNLTGALESSKCESHNELLFTPDRESAREAEEPETRTSEEVARAQPPRPDGAGLDWIYLVEVTRMGVFRMGVRLWTADGASSELHQQTNEPPPCISRSLVNFDQRQRTGETTENSQHEPQIFEVTAQLMPRGDSGNSQHEPQVFKVTTQSLAADFQTFNVTTQMVGSVLPTLINPCTVPRIEATAVQEFKSSAVGGTKTDEPSAAGTPVPAENELDFDFAPLLQTLIYLVILSFLNFCWQLMFGSI